MRDYYPDVTFEDGVFRFDLPNGDEFVIVPPKPRELSDEEIQTIDKLLDLCWNFSVSGVYFHEFQENVEAIEKVEAILKKASEK